MPVIAHIEIRVPLCQDIPDTGSHHPAVLVREVGELLKDGSADRGQVGLRGAGIPPGGRCSGSFIGIGIRRLGGFPDFIYKFEFVAGGDEGTRRFLLAHSDDQHARLTQARRQTGKVAVRGHKAEPLHASRVQNVHRVNNQRGVRRVFPGRVTVLLHGRKRILQQDGFPALHFVARPVRVNALIGNDTARCRLINNDLNVGGGDVVGVYQNRQPFFLCTVLVTHSISPPAHGQVLLPSSAIEFRKDILAQNDRKVK